MQICILNFRMEILRNMIFFVFLRYLVVCNIQKIILLFFLFLFLLKGLRKINEKKKKQREEGNRKARGLFCFSIIYIYIYIYIYIFIFLFFLRELGQLERVDSIGVDLVRWIWLG